MKAYKTTIVFWTSVDTTGLLPLTLGSMVEDREAVSCNEMCELVQDVNQDPDWQEEFSEIVDEAALETDQD
jgi:hypothetical protein